MKTAIGTAIIILGIFITPFLQWRHIHSPILFYWVGLFIVFYNKGEMKNFKKTSTFAVLGLVLHIIITLLDSTLMFISTNSGMSEISVFNDLTVWFYHISKPGSSLIELFWPVPFRMNQDGSVVFTFTATRRAIYPLLNALFFIVATIVIRLIYGKVANQNIKRTV